MNIQYSLKTEIVIDSKLCVDKCMYISDPKC